MPLIKSKGEQAVGQNISTEMKAGRSREQAIAIALSVQRAAKRDGIAAAARPSRYDRVMTRGR